MNDNPSKTPYIKIFDVNLSKKVRNEQDTKGKKPPTHDKDKLLKKVKKKIQKKKEERNEPRNQSKRPLIRMIDPNETDPLYLELKAEWMEKEKIPIKKLKLAEMINKKNNVIGYPETSQSKLNMKKTMNPLIPVNPNVHFNKIQIHSIKFNCITPTVWATLTQLTLQRTVHNVITDGFSFDSVKKHFPFQLSQQVIKQFSKEHKVDLKFNENIFGNKKEQEKFKAQNQYIHLLTAKEDMLQETMIFINRNYDSQMAMPLCNCHMPRKDKAKEKKRWNKKKQNRERKMTMQRSHNPSDYDMQHSEVLNGYGYEYYVMRHSLSPTLKSKTCIIHMVNHDMSNTRTKLMTAQELKGETPDELRQYLIMQPTHNTKSTPAKIEFNTLQSEAIMEQERIDEFYRRANMQTIKMDTSRIMYMP